MKGGYMNSEQEAAVDAGGLVFVSAGAGTGKTKVLVERFARAVCDEGVDVESILVITYTEKAAGELRGRIRARLVERGSTFPRARRESGARPPRRGVRGCAHGFLRQRRSRAAAAARGLRSERAAADADGRLRDAAFGRQRARARARRAPESFRARRGAPRSGALSCG